MTIAVADETFAGPSRREPPALLVSVRNAAEARLAIAGGCDILDVKEPSRGSLGMADLAEILAAAAVRDELAPTMPVSVALGDVSDWANRASSFSRASSPGTSKLSGIAYLKLGTAGVRSDRCWSDRFIAARRRIESELVESVGVHNLPQWVAVAYADATLADAPRVAAVVARTADCGCRGVLIDTYTKNGGGLFDWLSVPELREVALQAAREGLWFALAGRLTLENVPLVLEAGPEIVGIRSAGCTDGRRDAQIDPAAVSKFRAALIGRTRVAPTKDWESDRSGWQPVSGELES